MFINCNEKCTHQKDGICVKNDCASQNEYISGTVSCPHFQPKAPATEKYPVTAPYEAKFPIASEDHKHFSEV